MTGGVAVTSAGAREEGLTRWRLRSDAYRAARYGVFVPADTDPGDVDVRIEVAGLTLPAGAVVGGWAAARLHEARAGSDGLTVFDGRLPGPWCATSETLPILVTGSEAMRVSAVEGLCVFRSVVPPDERDVVGGVPVTSAERTAVDLARLWPLVPAVIALDRLLHREVVDAAAVSALLAARSGWRGAAAARRVLALSDGAAESPRESLLRMVWMAGGFPRPLCNPVVTDSRGRFVARVDLLDPVAGVVGEYDGAMHAGAGRRGDDARRQEALEDLGLTVIRANDPDVATPLGRDAWRRRLVRAYHRARHPGRPTGTWRVRDLDLRTDWSETAARAPKWSDLAPPHSSVRSGEGRAGGRT
jgi:hypothetical protein